MNTFKAIIVDDEPAGILALDRVLKDTPGIEIVATITNGREAVTAIEKYLPDIVFLDIEMPEYNGFDIAKATDHIPYHLVFVTAYSEHAVDAFTTKAIDYLLKPARPQLVRQCIDKILSTLKAQTSDNQKQNQTLLINDGQHEHAVNISTIAYIESIGRYQRITFNQKSDLLYRYNTLVTEGTLEGFCQKLEKHRFMRIHRSYLVNLASVRLLQRNERNWFAVLHGSEIRLPVARSRVHLLKQELSV